MSGPTGRLTSAASRDTSPGERDGAKRVGGKLQIDSATDRGTTVAGRLPTTMAKVQP